MTIQYLIENKNLIKVENTLYGFKVVTKEDLLFYIKRGFKVIDTYINKEVKNA